MDTKNRLIQKILKVAKRHKFLTYPILALVAIISVISNLFSWGTGAGKRVVAVVMVMVMLVSQSYFLTSSATEAVDDEETALVQAELAEEANGDNTDASAKSEAQSDESKETSDKMTETSTEVDSASDNNDNGNEFDEIEEENMNVGTSEEVATEDNYIVSEGQQVAGNTDVTDGDVSGIEEEELDSKLDGTPTIGTEITILYHYWRDNITNESTTLSEFGVTDPAKNKLVYNGDTTYDISVQAANVITDVNASSDYTDDGCYQFDEWYADPGLNTKAVTTSMPFVIDGDNLYIHLYASKKVAKYKVTINTNSKIGSTDDDTFTGTINSANFVNGAVVDVAYGETLTIDDLSRKGFKAAEPKIEGGDGGTVSVSADHKFVTITPKGDSGSCLRTVTLNWTGIEYYINYCKDEDGDIAYSQKIKYNDETHFLDPNDSAFSYDYSKEGWICDGWYIAGVNDGEDDAPITTANLISEYQDKLYPTGDLEEPRHSTVNIYPHYTYANITMEKTRLDYVYKEMKVDYSKTFSAQYLNKTSAGSDNFTYTLKSAGSLASKGVDVKAGAQGIIFTIKSGGPTGITDDEGIPVTLTVTDKTLPAGKQDIDQTITVYISPKTIELYPVYEDGTEAVTEKTYDGTTDTRLNNAKALKTSDDDVTISFGSAAYDDLNCAASKINLSDITFNFAKDGDNKQNYKLSPDYLNGSITKRPVYIKTSAKLSDWDSTLGYVRAGEANPDTKFELDSRFNKGDIGKLKNEPDSALGVSLKLSPERNDDNLTTDGTYTVKYDVDNDSNYDVLYAPDALGTFEVKHQPISSPELLYHFSDNKSIDEWHIGGADGKVTIEANNDSGYSGVRIYRNGSTTPEGNAIKQEDTGKKIGVQLFDEATGAVSAIEEISVKYQYTSPIFKGYRIIDTDDSEYYSTYGGYTTGLYFPNKGSVLDFGTYRKSVIKIAIQYTDNVSEMKELKYKLFNSSEFATTPFIDGEAVITVNEDAVKAVNKNSDLTASIIECMGVNNAGIESGSTILSPKAEEGSTEYYEWSIEAGLPQNNPLIVYSDMNKDTRRIVADQSGVPENQMEYYNHCQASLYVSDAVSGIESISWYITDEQYDKNTPYKKEDVHSNTKQESGTFTCDIAGQKVCRVRAVIRDNAGNEKTTNTVAFRLDDVDPNKIETPGYDDDKWTSNTTISFTSSDDLSGVDYIKVSDSKGKTIDCDIQKPNEETGVYLASFEATVKDTYSIIVADKAGNIRTKELDVKKISTVVPPCPEITVSPEEPNGDDGWYNAKGVAPTATISFTKESSDGTPVEAKYRRWKEGETGYNETPITDDYDITITEDGIFNVQAWVNSVSGVECANYNSHVKVIKVDNTKPDIDISTEKGSGASVIVNFVVTDNVSGVNPESIAVEHGGKLIDITKEETSEGVKGTFEISETGNYTIKATDNAGNESDEAAFTPMSLKVKAVTNITDTGATVAANVIKGTFDIKSAAISYRKYGDTTYTEAETIENIDHSTGNDAVSSALSELEPGTAYVYKVTATSDVNEILEYEGYFRTLSTDQSGIPVVGTARYSPDKDGDITVGIFDGNVCLMAEEIEAGNEFSFVNVPDGNYNIVATDGTYSKTTRLLIDDGMIVYPTQYIDLVLSGMNTSVVITTDTTPGVTVDDMDTIFDDNVAFTTERDPSTPDKMSDKELIESGSGTVEFKLYATLMTVSAVSADEISAMYAVTDNNKVVGAYLDLSLYKIVTGADGDVDRSRVTNLQNPAHISVTIPLGDLAGKPDLEVVRIHNDGENFIGASLADQDSNPSTYTITTDQFSTYAVLYSIGAGTTATSEEPTTANADASTQDVDVKVVTPTGQTGSTEPTPASSTEPTTYDDDDEDVKEIKDATKKPKASGTTTVGSLTSSGSAKTGDETPIMILFGFMMISICGVVVLRKKSKEAER